MDNQTAKEILSAYRPGGEDANDPFFHEALAQCEHDPEMRCWFTEQRAFDEQISYSLDTIRAPESGKRAILALAETGGSESTHPSFWRRHRSLLALAASLIMAFVLVSTISSSRDADPAPVHASAPTKLTDWIAQAMPLEFRHENTHAILAWLAERNAPVIEDLSTEWTGTLAAGCRIFKDPRGGTVSLVCLRIDRQLVHVFIFDPEAAKNFDGPRDQWWKEADYNLIARKHDDQLVAIVTRSGPDTVAHLL
jgi:hypothetical protein